MPAMMTSAPLQGVDTSTYVAESGAEVSYISAGTPAGRRIIYVHGTPGSATAFARYITDPIDGTFSISIDRPGFAGSAGSDAVVSFEEQARAIEPLLVENDEGWPILVGHSLGGPIVARAAADYPDRVGAVVILAGSLDPALERPTLINRAGAIWPLSAILPRSLNVSSRELIAAPEQTDLLDRRLDRISAPVTVIHGRRDRLVPVENVSYIRRKLDHLGADLRTITIAEEGHFLPWTRETVVRNAIRELLSRTEDPKHTPRTPETAD